MGSENHSHNKRKTASQPHGTPDQKRIHLGSLSDHVCPEISIPIYAPAPEHPPYDPFTFRTSEPRLFVLWWRMCPFPEFKINIRQLGATIRLKFPSPSMSDLTQVPRLEREIVNMNSHRELKFTISCPDGMTFVCNSSLDKIETEKVFGFSAKLEVKESEVEL